MFRQNVRSDVRLSRNEVRTQKERIVLLYAEWLRYLLIRSRDAMKLNKSAQR
jgi:hypothetical protein